MIDLGINIKTDEGIAKADGEIKEWVDKLNNELKDKKIKIEFDVPKEINDYFQQLKEGTDKANESMTELGKNVKKITDALGKGKGGGGGGKEVSDEYKKELKVIQDAWEELNDVQRDSSVGAALVQIGRAHV